MMNTKAIAIVVICFTCLNSCISQALDSNFIKSLSDTPVDNIIVLNKTSIKKIYDHYYQKNTAESSLLFQNIAFLYQNNSRVKKIKYFPHLLLERVVYKKQVTNNNVNDEIRNVLEILNSKLLMGKTKKMIKRLCSNDDFFKSELILVASKINSCKCLKKIKEKRAKVISDDIFSVSNARNLAILAKFKDAKSLKELDQMITELQKAHDHASVIKIVTQLKAIGGKVLGELIIDRILMSDYKFSSFDHEESDFLLAFSTLSELILDWQDKSLVNDFFIDADEESIKKRVRDWVIKNRTQIKFKP